ncbi:YdbH domain-containing protein [Hyphomonas sp.]|uniref:intermembrane phospholipid transport protein YdbH family protein n=1 Tax=Hyphomonas sp. TaxID=87 RepID=UPI00391C18D4
MKPVDATEMRSLQKGRKAGPLVWTRRLILGFLFVLIVSIVLLWVMRKPIAERALQAWCADRDLTCEAKFTTISADGAVLSGVRITSGRNVPAEAQEVSARISWPGLFSPRIEGITIGGLAMRGMLGPGGLRFYGLERLAAPGTGQAGPAPPVEIRDARIFLDTPFGPAAATLNVSGKLPEAASASLRLDPGRLSLGPAHLAFTEARFSARVLAGEVTGDVRLSASSAALGGYGAEGFVLAAEARAPMSLAGDGRAEWSVRAAGLTAPEAEVRGLRSRGQAGFTLAPGMDFTALGEALTLLVMQAEADSAAVGDWTAGRIEAGADLEMRGGALAGPVSAEVQAVDGPQARAGSLRLAGDAIRRGDGGVTFEGGAQAVNAGLAPEVLAPVQAALRLPEPLDAHGAALSRALGAAAADFDAAFGLALRYGPDGLAIRSEGPAGLAASSGLRLDVDVADTAAWLAVAGGEVLLTGAARMAGGGAPSVSAEIGLGRISGGAVTLERSSLALSPWTAGGRTVSAGVTGLAFRGGGEEVEVSGTGEATFTGAFAGFDLTRTRMSGGLDAAMDETGWRVQAMGAPCLALSSAGIALGAVSVPQAAFDVCPVDGRFIRQGGPPGGAARLGDVRFPIRFDGGSGDVALSGARADWTLQQGFGLTLRAEAVALPVELGENTLVIDGAAPEIRVRTAAGGGPVQIAAALAKTEFGGTLIPAKVEAAGFGFDGVSAPDGMAGAVRAGGVRISDPAPSDPLYQPVMGDFAGRLDGRRLVMAGPMRNEAAGFALARAETDLDIFELTGTARVVGEPLVFRPGGVQPAMISQRLVGLFTNAEGRFSGAADFTIARGQIEATADLALDGFGFQTTRLGRVSGVSGTVRFSDLMGLTTAPGQEVRIGSVDPGVAFTDGRIVFAFEGGETLKLDEVRFPFAGGDLSLAPLEWKLGGAPERVSVAASRLDLTQLIEALKLPDTRAEGTVSGAFPIAFTPTSVVVEDARLKADAGGGRLAYTGAAMEAAADADPVASMAFNALRDLEFSILEIGLSGDLAGQMRAEMQIAGRNVRPVPVTRTMTMPPGQAFEFAMGFNLPLGQLISQGLQLADARTVLEVVTDLDTDGGRLPQP